MECGWHICCYQLIALLSRIVICCYWYLSVLISSYQLLDRPQLSLMAIIILLWTRPYFRPLFGNCSAGPCFRPYLQTHSRSHLTIILDATSLKSSTWMPDFSTYMSTAFVNISTADLSTSIFYYIKLWMHLAMGMKNKTFYCCNRTPWMIKCDCHHLTAPINALINATGSIQPSSSEQ